MQGQSALEVLQLVADLVKQRKCSCPPAVVRCLLLLRFERVTSAEHQQELQGKRAKKKKKKGGKKGNKVLEEVEKDFQEAEAGPNAEEQAMLQSQMLEVRGGALGEQKGGGGVEGREGKDFQEAEAGPSAEEQDLLQSQMLEVRGGRGGVYSGERGCRGGKGGGNCSHKCWSGWGSWSSGGGL